MTHLDRFLDSLKTVLPEMCTDRDLVLHVPNIFKSLPTIHRMRLRGQVPPHFYVEPNYYYLRDEVVCWIHSKYQHKEDFQRDCSVIKLHNPGGGA
jgi:hypothetical protein